MIDKALREWYPSALGMGATAYPQQIKILEAMADFAKKLKA